SKSTLNAAMANIATDAKKDGVIVVILSPGQVRVEKIAQYKIPGMIEVPEAIGGMTKVLENATLAECGNIIRYNGEQQPFSVIGEIVMIMSRRIAAVMGLAVALAASSGFAAEAPLTALITGANRGIGFEFAKQYAERGYRVIATARDPAKAAE